MGGAAGLGAGAGFEAGLGALSRGALALGGALSRLAAGAGFGAGAGLDSARLGLGALSREALGLGELALGALSRGFGSVREAVSVFGWLAGRALSVRALVSGRALLSAFGEVERELALAEGLAVRFSAGRAELACESLAL